MTDPLAQAWILRPAALSQRKPTRFDLRPDADQRAVLAQEIGIDAITDLRFRGELRPIGRQDLALHATLTATALQPCVVTMAPVTTRIAEDVTRRYIHGLAPPEGDEVEVPEDVTEDPLSAVIDLRAIMAEALLLALPLYPRAQGAEFGSLVHAAKGVAPLRDEDVKPLAGLAALAGHLFGPDATNPQAAPGAAPPPDDDDDTAAPPDTTG